MASEMSCPMLSSEAEMAATCAMAVLSSTSLEIFFSSSTAASVANAMPFFSTMGLAPAATFLRPSLTMACASTAAVVVPSPATSLVLVDTSRMICAPMFSKGSATWISFAMVTPSLVTRGVPKDLSSTTFLPLGPRVILTVFARVSTPASRAFLASSPYLNCLAIVVPPIIQRSPGCPPDAR